jgi:maltodextrin utilization protein YvdJ
MGRSIFHASDGSFSFLTDHVCLKLFFVSDLWLADTFILIILILILTILIILIIIIIIIIIRLSLLLLISESSFEKDINYALSLLRHLKNS